MHEYVNIELQIYNFNIRIKSQHRYEQYSGTVHRDRLFIFPPPLYSTLLSILFASSQTTNVSFLLPPSTQRRTSSLRWPPPLLMLRQAELSILTLIFLPPLRFVVDSWGFRLLLHRCASFDFFIWLVEAMGGG